MNGTSRTLRILRLDASGRLIRTDSALGMIAENALRSPSRVALRLGDTDVTYGDLWSASSSLRTLIESSATDPARPVALSIDKHDARLFASMIAVLRCGRFFVVLDRTYPEARNRLVLEDADPSLLLSDEGPGELPSMQDLLYAAPVGEELEPEPDPDTIACLVYTSGSTGRPKGVMIPRGCLAQIAHIQGSHIGIEPGTRMSMLSSPSVFGGMRTIWGGLPSGATICPFTVETEGLERMAEWLRSERIAILHCTPSVLRHFGKSLPADARFNSLRIVIFGADRVLAEDIALARSLFQQDVRVWTGLGASETGTVSGRLVDPAEVLPEGQMPLGPPVPGREARLLDEQGMPVPEGETGELVVEGKDLALGYWRQPERSAEVFGETGTPGRRRYRTGDLARVMPDGSLLHMGRRDFMVKVRGVRVDLGEVESVLAKCAKVRECALRAFTGADEDTALVAFVQFRDTEDLDAVREHLAQHLPPAMRPQRYVVMHDWPRTVSGKLDRKALQVPGPQATPEITDLHDETESRVAQIWSAVLDRKVTHRDTDFFEAGGNSLSAMRVIVRVHSELARDLPPTALFRTPRLADFALIVAGAAPAAARKVQAPDRALTEGPLSPAQKALWFIEKLEGPSSTYNISLALRLTGQVDTARMAGAIGALRDRHEALRTIIHEVGDEVLQKVLAPGGRSVPLSPRLVHEQVEGEPALQDALRNEVRKPIRASGGALWRARLISAGPTDHALVLTLHHIVCDGWSLQILGEDLSAFYSGDAQRLPDVQGRMLDVASAQHERARKRADADSLRYWADRLQGLGNLELPTDRARAGFQTAAGATLRLPMPEALRNAVLSLARSERVTPFIVQLAAFQALLARYSGTLDFGIGIPAANRPVEALERVVGYFVNMLVVRAPLAEAAPFREQMRQVHEAVLEAMARQDVAFEQIVGELAPAREGNRNPLFQVAFAVQNQPRGSIAFAGLAHEVLSLRGSASKFDLTLEVGESGEQPWVEIEYRTELFDEATIARLATHYLAVLSALTAAPDTGALSAPMLSPAERQQLLEDWNATTVPRPRGERLDELVLAQCARTPQAVAMASESSTTTYGDMAARIDALQRSLQSLALKPGEPVGVLMPRSPDLIIAALAIMRAGGAYVPLDPRWPAQRLQTVIEAAGVRLVLRPDSIETHVAKAPARTARTGSPIAYILFTSGSTGTPKGVEITHESLCNHHHWFIDCTGMSASDAVLFRTAPTFDISLVEMFAPLLVGGRIVIARDQGEMDPDYIAGLMCEHGVTLHQATPSSCRLLLASSRLAECTSLRWFACGGEALDMPLARALHEVLPQARIGNFYGPTEATIWATFQEISDWDATLAPIGRPIANLRSYVLDERLQPLPIGVWGELHLGGTGVAQGYCQRPDLTAERFIEDPFHAGGRVYRTGDRARWRADGTLEFSGRRDGQVKIRGYRIEIGEVETSLQKLDDIAQAVVTVAPGAGTDTQMLVAFIVPREGSRAEVDDVKARLALVLPRYMIPQRIEIRDALPLLSSGKVDRKTLLASLEAIAAPSAEPESLSPREAQLLGIWREVLGRQDAGVDDDFFALGGHSLLAFRLADLIQRQLEQPCSLRMLFSHPTVRQLSRALGDSLRSREGAVVLPLQESGSRPPLYCICGIQLYRELAQSLGPDVPVRGVFLPWEESVLRYGKGQDQGVEEIAARYLEAIRAEQPDGPFSLLGVSFGGVLAFEMAQQMARAGEPVPLVVVLDIPPVEERRSLRRSLGRMRATVVSRVRALMGGRGPSLDAPATPADLRKGLYERAMRGYRTSPYPGRLLVVRASERHRAGVGADPALGWGEHVANLAAIDAPGDHLGILRSAGVPVIAETLRRELP